MDLEVVTIVEVVVFAVDDVAVLVFDVLVVVFLTVSTVSIFDVVILYGVVD